MKPRKKKAPKGKKKRTGPVKRNRPKKYSRFPLARHVKNTLEFLKKNRSEYSYEEIRNLAPIKLSQIRKVEKLEVLLHENPKISYNQLTQKFRYQAKFSGISSIQNVKEVVSDESFRISGVDCTDLQDAYEGVVPQLAEFKRLEKSREIAEVFVVPNSATKSDILYYNTPRYRLPKIHEKLREEWRNTTTGEEFPRVSELVDIFLQNEFKKRGIVYTSQVEWVSDRLNNKRKREIEMEEGKKVKRRKLRKITNVHLLSAEEQMKYFKNSNIS